VGAGCACAGRGGWHGCINRALPLAQAFVAALAAIDMSASQLLKQTDLLTVLLAYHVSTDVYPTVQSLVAARTVKTLLTNDTLTISRT
jgi:hypothetical protein